MLSVRIRCKICKQLTHVNCLKYVTVQKLQQSYNLSQKTLTFASNVSEQPTQVQCYVLLP